MEYRILPSGASIPVSNRYRAHQMFAAGQSLENVTQELGISRALACQYRYEVRMQQRAKGEIMHCVGVNVPAGLSPAVRKALTDYLTNACVPVFLASLVKSTP